MPVAEIKALAYVLALNAMSDTGGVSIVEYDHDDCMFWRGRTYRAGQMQDGVVTYVIEPLH